MAKAPTKKKVWTYESYCASGLDRREDTFGASLTGLSVAEFKSLPESKDLDRIWVKLLNRADKLKSEKRGK